MVDIFETPDYAAQIGPTICKADLQVCFYHTKPRSDKAWVEVLDVSTGSGYPIRDLCRDSLEKVLLSEVPTLQEKLRKV